MSDDIVERLRTMHGDLRQGAYYSSTEAPDWNVAEEAADGIEQLRAALTGAVEELDAEHYSAADVKGRWCIICGPADGSWPCSSRMIADDLRQALDNHAGK